MDISTLNSHYERLQQLSKNEGTLDGLKAEQQIVLGYLQQRSQSWKLK